MKINRWIPFMVMAGMLISSQAVMAQDQNTEQQQPVEIEGPQPEIQAKPVKRIDEPAVKIPEVPKPITRPRLSPAEEIELQKEEHKRATGATTQTEYEIKKDTLGRDSNIKF